MFCFFSQNSTVQRFQTNVQTNSEWNQEPNLELQDSCTHKFYQKAPLLLLSTSYTSEQSRTFMFTYRNKDLIGAHNRGIAFIWVWRRFKLKRESLKKTRCWLVVSGNLLLAENLKWKENQKIEVSLPYGIVLCDERENGSWRQGF